MTLPIWAVVILAPLTLLGLLMVLVITNGVYQDRRTGGRGARRLRLLDALLDGPATYAEIERRVSDYSRGEARIGPGTFVSLVRELQGSGLLTHHVPDPDPTADEQEWRVYVLTEAGVTEAREKSGVRA